MVGRASAMVEGLEMLAATGRYLEIGTFFPGTTAAVDPGRLVMRNLRIDAVAMYDARSLQEALSFLERHRHNRSLEQAVAEYPLEAINDAFADQDAGRVARASIVMN
jgi:D-arabinose 1-dehydrogenase-like Zn-dependent alcohol dehydrogenase